MTFLNPLILFGLIAAAIPLIIHLFNFRRPRKVDFSSLAFLKELQQTTMQRVQIKQWLLLLLRTLALASLILAFARPTLTSNVAATFGGRANSSVAVILDNSLSMTLRDGNGEYLAQARELADAVIQQMEPGDEVFVLSSEGETAAGTAPFNSRGSAQEAVADIEAMPATSSTVRSLMKGSDLLSRASNLNREIYFFSDFQRSTLLDSVGAELPGSARVVLVPVGDRRFANVAVTGVRVLSRIIEVSQPVRIEATLVNYGQERIEDYLAGLFLEGERVAQGTADLEPGAPATVVFTVTPQRRGWLSGLVQTEDDAFPYDNERFFTLNVPEQRRLLVVRGEEQRTDYVELALSPKLTGGRVALEVETVPESALASKNLGAYDAVVLVGPRSLSSGEVASLARYVEEGGGLLFFPGPAAQAEDYNALFAGLGAGRFSGFSGNLGSGAATASFDRVDLEHPLFEGVFGGTGQPGSDLNVERPDLYYAMNYTPGSGTEQTLIQMSNGFPFLQEIRHGQGSAFVLAVAPDARWSDFPVRGLFIPLLYRSIYYLSSTESVAGEQFLVGKPAELRVTGVSESQTLRLVSPGGEEITPEQRGLFGAILMTFGADIRTPGVYDVRAGDRLVRRVAFNMDQRESNLQTYSGQEAQAALAEATDADVRVMDAGRDGAARIMQEIKESRSGVELWNVFLLLALIFLAAEMVVARQWRPESVSA